MAAQRAQGPQVLGVFVDQLKRLAAVPIRNCAEPPTFARTKGFNPTAQCLDKEHLGHPREHSELAGTLAASGTIRCRIVSSQSRSAAASSAGPAVAIPSRCSVMGATG